MYSPPNLRLSIQRAMLGAVTANLAAVTADVRGSEIRISATFYAPADDRDREEIECVATEVVADFPDGYTVSTEFHSLDEGTPSLLDFWAFVRAGVIVSQIGLDDSSI